MSLLAAAALSRGAGRALASDLHTPQHSYPPAAPALEAPAAILDRGDLLPHELPAIRVFEQTKSSVVNITHIRAMQNFYTLDIHRIPVGQGSGFIWDRWGGGRLQGSLQVLI